MASLPSEAEPWHEPFPVQNKPSMRAGRMRAPSRFGREGDELKAVGQRNEKAESAHRLAWLLGVDEGLGRGG
jgi:hypothetical protein